MEIDQHVLKIGAIASQTLLHSVLPQRLTPEELDAVAGGHFGFDTLAGHLYPEMVRVLERFGGGKVDAAMKAKLQTWLAGWVNPPEHYVIHHPVQASGQWWRIFRTTMFVQQDLDEALDSARILTEEELEARYAGILGLGARERYPSHAAWWDVVLATIRMGTWHLAVYSPRYQAFISPYVLDAEDSGGEVLKEIRAEWPKPIFRLYTSEETAGYSVFDFARMIERGSFIEVLGSLQPAPPFGETWGPGVAQTNPGNSQGWIVSGFINAWTDDLGVGHRRVYTVQEAPEVGGVAIDGPDPFRLVQALHAVTGWLPKGVNPDLMAPERLSDLVTATASQLGGSTGDAPIIVPKGVFLDAILTHPGLVPVYGRVMSLAI